MADTRRSRLLAAARARRRSPGATLVSLALHGVLAVVLARALEIHAPFVDFFQHDDVEPSVERVTFVAAPAPASGPRSPEPEGGGDGRMRTPAATPAPPRLVAPSATPDRRCN